MATPRRQSSNRKRIPVALPYMSDGGGGYLTASFFRVPNIVAVAMYQNPVLPAMIRVWIALVFACVQDAKAGPATFRAGEEPRALVIVAAAHLAQATKLHEKSIPRVLRELRDVGLIYWRHGDAHHQPAFAVQLDPPSVTRVRDLDLSTPGSVTEPVTRVGDLKTSSAAMLPFSNTVRSQTRHGFETEEGKEEKEEVSLSGDTAMSGDISHQGTDGEERATRRGDDASFQRRNGWSVTGDAGLGGEWADGEPCYAYLDRERWDRVRSQLPRNSPLRIQDGRMVQVSAIGSRLTFWFQYGYHRLKAMNDRPVLRRLVRQELGDDIVVELRETAELLDMEPVA